MKKDNISHMLNFSGKVTRIFINSKITLLIIISSLIFGTFSLLFTPRTYNPEILVPLINIKISRPSSDTKEIYYQAIKPLEALMRSIPGVEHTYGMASNGKGLVTVRFKVNESEELSLVKVYNQLNSNLDKMPPGTLHPLIQSVSLYDVPILTLTLYSNNGSQEDLRNSANILLEKIRDVPNLGKTWIIGTSKIAIKILLKPDMLEQYQIPIDKIKQTLTQNNIPIDAGLIETINQNNPIRIFSEVSHPNELQDTLIGVYNGKPVFLKDVAEITRGMVNPDIQSYFVKKPDLNKKNAITIAIARQKNSNSVTIAKNILDKIHEIRKLGIIPSDIKITLTRNDGEEANIAVNTLVEHLGIAIFSVVILLMLFLGWKESSIVILSIPIILSIVLGIGWLAGQTINRITLFALILSLGLLVDDSIVVIENIHRHLTQKFQPNFYRLILLAANEIGKPTIIATFTVILALIPMQFVSGMMGPFMAPIPFNAPLAMFISLFIAYSVVPYLAYRWLRIKKNSNIKKIKNESHEHFLSTSYKVLFMPLLYSKKSRFFFYFSIIILMISALFQPLWQFIKPDGVNTPLSSIGVGLKMLPDDNVNTFLIQIDSGAGSSLQKTSKLVKEIEPYIQKNSYVKNYQVFFGEAAPEDFGAMVRGDSFMNGTNFSQIRINLINKKNRKIGSHAIVQDLFKNINSIFSNHPQAKIKFFESPPGPPVKAQMEAAIYGPNYKQQQLIAEDISKNIYSKIYGMVNIDNSVTENVYEYRIKIDRKKALLAGIEPLTITNEILSLFNGIIVGSIHSPKDREPKFIQIELPKNKRNKIESIQNMLILNKQGELVSIKSLVSINKNYTIKPIYTRDQHPITYLTGDMLFSAPAYGVTTITQKIKNQYFQKNIKVSIENLGFIESEPKDLSQYQLFWMGEMRLTLDVFRDLGGAFIIAILLIYILLTAFYKSFFLPLIIMGAIPLTIIGVFPGHWLMNQPFTATSMIGVIALAGIVVRNSLLLIDFILENKKHKQTIEEAVVHAGQTRALPILLTAFAIILGSFIMLSDPVFGGLAISLIFGAFASTILTLFVIPLIYYDWMKIRNFFKKSI